MSCGWGCGEGATADGRTTCCGVHALRVSIGCSLCKLRAGPLLAWRGDLCSHTGLLCCGVSGPDGEGGLVGGTHLAVAGCVTSAAGCLPPLLSLAAIQLPPAHLLSHSLLTRMAVLLWNPCRSCTQAHRTTGPRMAPAEAGSRHQPLVDPTHKEQPCHRWEFVCCVQLYRRAPARPCRQGRAGVRASCLMWLSTQPLRFTCAAGRVAAEG
jgi:hypothetical protein